jgi:hypothetical protein
MEAQLALIRQTAKAAEQRCFIDLFIDQVEIRREMSMPK